MLPRLQVPTRLVFIPQKNFWLSDQKFGSFPLIYWEKLEFSQLPFLLRSGLGKTFIAAVVMFNFWRWYPMGKIVFLAPTKPLVAQQINACHDVMGIPKEETIELTGKRKKIVWKFATRFSLEQSSYRNFYVSNIISNPSVKNVYEMHFAGSIDQKKRQAAWNDKAGARVIFATPQVFHNDLEKNIIPAELVKCVVVDEAHRALGKHSYCEVTQFPMAYTSDKLNFTQF